MLARPRLDPGVGPEISEDPHVSAAPDTGKPWVGRGLPVIAAAVLAAGLGPVGFGAPRSAAAHPASDGQRLAAQVLAGLEPAADNARRSQVGVASWYGPGFHGRLTASGETYDAAARTVAHRTLPLGTIVRIDNLGNGRHVVARVNDRGPYIDGRIVDCSYAVARALGFARSGVARVRVTALDSLASAVDFERTRPCVRLPWVKTRSSFIAALDEPLLEDDVVAAAPAVALGTRVSEAAQESASAPALVETASLRQASLVPYPTILHASRHAATWLSGNGSRLAIPFDLRGRLQRIRLRDLVRSFVA
jgi:rare lipoprotein A (peptidoglycan hydrolase)